MKQAWLLALAAAAMAVPAFAQIPDAGSSPGPHDPNPPMATPDLRLPSPCAPTPNLAAAVVPASPVTPHRSIGGGRVIAADSGNPTQCSANTVSQSAELPLSSAAAQ